MQNMGLVLQALIAYSTMIQRTARLIILLFQRAMYASIVIASKITGLQNVLANVLKLTGKPALYYHSVLAADAPNSPHV